jgi:hypothetical protein
MRAAAAMTVVQISDYQSPRKTPLRKRQRYRDWLHGYRGIGSGVLIACGMILAWVAVSIVVAGVGPYLG